MGLEFMYRKHPSQEVSRVGELLIIMIIIILVIRVFFFGRLIYSLLFIGCKLSIYYVQNMVLRCPYVLELTYSHKEIKICRYMLLWM